MAKHSQKTQKKMGRPRKEIKKEQFESMCAIQCTLDEICAVLGVTDVTLNTWCKETYEGRTFSEVFAEKRGLGKMSLRRSQFKLAEKSAAMAIFLGKNYLGQTDTVTNQVQLVEDDPLSVAFKELNNGIQQEATSDSSISE